MPSGVGLHLLVAINPRAAFGRHGAAGLRVAERLTGAGHRVTLVQAGDADALADHCRIALGEGADVLVVVGGDGMVSLGVNAVADTRTPLGIIAVGTGNDIARGLELPIGDPDAAVEALLEGLERSPRRVDAALIRCGEHSVRFVGVASAGFDAIVNERANRMTWPRGPSRYVFALLRELATFRPIAYRIHVDGVLREERAMLVAVANNVSIGGGMRITPDALLDDGRLDLLVVGRMSRLRFLSVFRRVYSGTHTSLSAVSIVRAQRVRIDAPGVVVYADGERVGTLPVDVEVLPGALRVIV